MEQIIRGILAHKGIKSYRSTLLLAVLYVAWKVTDLDKRVAVLEARKPSATQTAALPATHQSGPIDPDWIKHLADALKAKN